MKFCTRCGHRNTDDSAYCEACGHALRPKSAAAPAGTGLDTGGAVPFGARKMARIGALVLLVLIAVAAGMHFLLAPAAPTAAALAAAAGRHLEAHPEFGRDRLCLRNFRYSQDPAVISGNDSRAQKWFEMLAKAGLYQDAEKRTGSGWFAQNQLAYRKTDAGKKATESGRLCFAEGLMVKRVENIAAPADLNDKSIVQADVVLGYRNAAPWIGSDTARELAPESLTGDLRYSWRWGLREGKWIVLDGDGSSRPARAARAPLTQATPEAPAATGFDGFLKRLKNLFSGAAFGGNPLIGKWETSMMGLIMLQYEFTTDAMRTNDGEEVKVRYEVRERDKQVLVYPEGQSMGLIVKVVDQDTIEINVGPAGMRFKRVP